MNYLRMEIKVCEGCGALWLRAASTSTSGPVLLNAATTHVHSEGVYCRTCVRSLAQYPTSRVARGQRPARVRNRNQQAARQPLAAITAGGAR